MGAKRIAKNAKKNLKRRSEIGDRISGSSAIGHRWSVFGGRWSAIVDRSPVFDRPL